MRIFGYKDMVIKEVARSVNTDSRALLMQRVLFVMEELTGSNWRFWSDYAATMKACAKNVPHSSEIEAAIKGFTNGLELAGTPTASVYVVYSTFDLSTVGANNVHKMINIQMCMTVTTSATDLDFPAVTHMGIFRSPLLSVTDLSGVPANIVASFKTQSHRDFYHGKPAKGISLVLHSFAAHALPMMRKGRPPIWMITAPLPHMGSLLGDVGKIIATDVSQKNSASTPSPVGVSMSPSPVGKRTLPSRLGMPMSPSSVGMPALSSRLVMPASSSPVGVPGSPSRHGMPTSSSPVGRPTSPKIGAPDPVANASSSAKDASSSSSSPNAASETSPVGVPAQVNHLTYAVDRTTPWRCSLEIRYQGFHRIWGQIDHPWLFMLAFNPSHKYAATFSDLRVLRELHQDIVMMGTERTLELTVVTPSPDPPRGPGPHTSQLGTGTPNPGTVKGAGPQAASSFTSTPK